MNYLVKKMVNNPQHVLHSMVPEIKIILDMN